jgi:uncharacterized protein (PEP-CTERM system associated)
MASMASNRNNPGPQGLSLAGLSLALLMPVSASAVDFDFKPTLSLMERYSDNVSLEATNQKTSFLTEIRPGFSLTSKGTRTQFSVDYGLQALLYSHDSDANTHNNQLTARLASDWLDRRLAINADARIGRQNINSTGAIGTGNYNITENSTETRTFSIAPAWKSRFGNQANLDARWQLTYSDSDSPNLSSTTANSLALNLSSGTSFNQIPWGLAYRVSGSDGNTNGDRNSSFSGTLGYIHSPKTRFNLTLGRDSNNGTTTGFDQASGMYWNAGINWAPTLRTSLNATAGKRYNSDSYGLNLTHRTRKSTWALRYREEIVDAYAQLTATGAFDIYDCGGIPRLVVAGGAPPDSSECGNLPPQLLVPALQLPYSQLVDGFNLNRSWSGSTTYKTGKSVFSLSMNKSNRKLLASNGSDNTYGLVGSWTLRVGPRTSSSLLFNATHSETNNPASAESDDLSLAWLLSYQLSRQATGVVELRRVERTSGTATGAYDENSVSARLNMSF